MTAEQFRALYVLLAISWRSGALPNIDVELARLVGVTPTRWKRHIAPAVLPHFVIQEDGKLVHPRLEKEKADAITRRKRASNAGTKRWQKTSQISTLQSSIFKGPDINRAEPENLTALLPPTLTPTSTLSPYGESHYPPRGIGQPSVADAAADNPDQELPYSSDGVPYQEMADLWNEIAGHRLGRVTKVTPKRKNYLRLRWGNDLDCSLEKWEVLLRRAITSAFLCGENDRDWRADFDWMLNQNNMVRVLEGKYDDRGRRRRVDPGSI